MSNSLYNKAREGFLSGSLSWIFDDIRVILVDLNNYTFSADHDTLADVPPSARIATAQLGGRTATDGYADADDVILSSVVGPTCEALIIYQHNESQKLICFIDRVADGLPVSPNGSNINVSWGPSPIFKL